jgi:hypothetical protein
VSGFITLLGLGKKDIQFADFWVRLKFVKRRVNKKLYSPKEGLVMT